MQPHCCRFLGQAVQTATFPSSNVTAAMRQDIAASTPSLHTTACFLSEESICSPAGHRFQNCSGHPPDYVITGDVRLHSP